MSDPTGAPHYMMPPEVPRFEVRRCTGNANGYGWHMGQPWIVHPRGEPWNVTACCDDEENARTIAATLSQRQP